MTAAQRSGAVGGIHDETVGDILSSRRRGVLVGRGDEVEIFGSLLDREGPAVCYVHGPGGIGKSSLLDLFAEAARERDVPVRRLDGKELHATQAAVLDAVAPVPEGVRPVLMVDSFERLRELEAWFRSHALPRLPASAVVVLAGRDAPDPEWRIDPAWRDVLHVVELGNLDRKECEEYLRLTCPDPALHARIIEVTHGHPLGLSLLTDVAVRDGTPESWPLGPDLVAALLRRFLDVVPDGVQRQALGILALARVTTEPLLRSALELDDAHALFEWLRALSFVETTPHGLQPHDLARDALDADLRWRDLPGYADAYRSVANQLVSTLQSSQGEQQLHALLDAKFMHRHQRLSGVWADWETFGRHRPEPATPRDHDAVLAMIESWEGPESSAIASRWLQRQPQGFLVVRQADGQVRGALALIDLTAASAEDISADPGASSAWAYAERHLPHRAGEHITMSRFTIDRESYQQPSPTMNLAPVLSIQHFLQAAPRLRASFVALDDPDRWQEYFTFYEIPRVPDGDFVVGGRRFGLFVRDFRRIALDPWLRLMLERDLLGQQAPGAPEAPVPAVALTRDEFHAAVRRALRDLRRTALLSDNPLARSRLVLSHDKDRAPAEALRERIHDALKRLSEDPRDEKLLRVLDRTFVRPAASQEKAAEVLGLPLSTYKRYLKAGIERVAGNLWDQEMDLS